MKRKYKIIAQFLLIMYLISYYVFYLISSNYIDVLEAGTALSNLFKLSGPIGYLVIGYWGLWEIGQDYTEHKSSKNIIYKNIIFNLITIPLIFILLLMSDII